MTAQDIEAAETKREEVLEEVVQAEEELEKVEETAAEVPRICL